MLTLPSGERLAFSTDSFVVSPLRFPGGSIGHLAVHGTANDLSVTGAVPRWLSVAKGAADGLYITTAGVGIIPAGRELSRARVRPGDKVLLSGTLADHGMAVMLARGDLGLEADIRSDTAPETLPVTPLVQGACDLLGIDPVYVACEGKFAAVVPADEADDAVAALRAHPLGRDACVIGEIRAEPEGVVALRNAFGGTRIVDMLVGDPLPRIC